MAGGAESQVIMLAPPVKGVAQYGPYRCKPERNARGAPRGFSLPGEEAGAHFFRFRASFGDELAEENQKKEPSIDRLRLKKQPPWAELLRDEEARPVIREAKVRRDP